MSEQAEVREFLRGLVLQHYYGVSTEALMTSDHLKNNPLPFHGPTAQGLRKEIEEAEEIAQFWEAAAHQAVRVGVPLELLSKLQEGVTHNLLYLQRKKSLLLQVQNRAATIAAEENIPLEEAEAWEWDERKRAAGRDHREKAIQVATQWYSDESDALRDERDRILSALA